MLVGDAPRSQREREPPICVDTNATPIKTLSVQIKAIYVPASPWEHGSPV
jgi:hypothetical protein